MIVYRTILHPTDFSEYSRYAFEVALAMAKACQSRLVVLHVKEPLTPDMPRRFEDQEFVLEQLTAQRPTDDDLPLTYQLVQGDAAVEIVRMARKVSSDLIVMGSHGRTGLPRLVIGSVAEEVARDAPCPVLIVRNGKLEPTVLPPTSEDQVRLATTLRGYPKRDQTTLVGTEKSKTKGV